MADKARQTAGHSGRTSLEWPRVNAASGAYLDSQ